MGTNFGRAAAFVGGGRGGEFAGEGPSRRRRSGRPRERRSSVVHEVPLLLRRR